MKHYCGFCEHSTQVVKFEKDKTTWRTKEIWKLVCKKHDETINDSDNNDCTDYEDIFDNMFQWRGNGE